MSKENPYEIVDPKRSDLNKFSQTFLQAFTPTNKKGKPILEKVRVPDAPDVKILKIKTKKVTTKVPKKVTIKRPGKKNLVINPREEFLSQNDDLIRLKGKFKKENVDKLIDKKTKMPEFNLERVKLRTPSLRKLPDQLF